MKRARNIISHLRATFSKFGWFVLVLFLLCNKCYMIAIQDFHSRLTIWTLVWNKCTLAWIKEAAWSAVLFISIVMNSRYKLFSWKIFRASRNLQLATWNSKPWNSILNSQKHRVSRIEFRVKTVNLHLTSTVSSVHNYLTHPIPLAASLIR